MFRPAGSRKVPASCYHKAVHRLLIAAVLAALAVTAVVVYTGVSRDREYRRLIAEGDQALAADQTFVAIEAFSGAITLRGDAMLGYLKRGETYRRRGDLAAALRDLRMAARLDPAATRPLEQLGDVHYASQRYARAAERYAEYVRLDDRNPRVLYKLALSRYRQGNTAAAIPPLRQAVQLDERFAEAHYLLGLCLREQRRTDEALEALGRAIALDPALVRAREALANLYAALNRTTEAIAQLEALAAIDPERVDRPVSLGLAYARAGRTDLAVLTLGRAAERQPEHPQVHLALARVWLDLAEMRGDRVALSKALEALQNAMVAGPETSEGLALQGRALLLTGEADIAQRVFQQATEQFPVFVPAFEQLADVAQRRGDLTGARDALIRHDALTGDAADPKARLTRSLRIGELSLKLGEPGVALVWLERAAEAGAPGPSLLGRLAEARWRTGDVEAARTTLAAALEKAPNDPALLMLRRQIR